ncbi:MAG: LysR family transcriptional regulator [Proteobacteria bacterium]|nr:LysR family transcriptional regulator [Burkholderiales bacterium]
MTLQQLRCLCAVVDEALSITKAAHRLHTSQSAVSRHIQLLEGELQARLIDRQSNRTVALTPTGQALLPTARRILKDVQSMRDTARDSGDMARGRITIATTHVHARYTLAPAFSRFRVSYPAVTLNIVLGRPAEIARWVSTGEADLGLGLPPADLPPGLLVTPCWRLPHSIICAPRHPIARAKRLTIETLARHPLITTGPGSRLGEMVLERFAAHGVRPQLAMLALDIEMIKIYVEAGLGIGVVPTISVRPGTGERLAIREADGLFPSSLAVLFSQNDPSARVFVRECMNMILAAPTSAHAERVTDDATDEPSARRASRSASGATGVVDA